MSNLRKALAIFLLAICLAPAHADEAEERMKAAQELVDATMTDTFVTQMAGSAWPPMEAQIKGKNANISDATVAEMKAEFLATMRGYISDLMVDMTPVYAKHFTAQELKDLLAFQTSPLGQKTLATQPKIMAEAMPKILSGTQRIMPQLLKSFQEKVKKRGPDL